MVSRNVLTELCTALPNLDDSVSEATGRFILDKIQQRVISFEDQVMVYAWYEKKFHLYLNLGICWLNLLKISFRILLEFGSSFNKRYKWNSKVKIAILNPVEKYIISCGLSFEKCLLQWPICTKPRSFLLSNVYTNWLLWKRGTCLAIIFIWFWTEIVALI
mgnify:CR=1 FL=1